MSLVSWKEVVGLPGPCKTVQVAALQEIQLFYDIGIPFQVTTCFEEQEVKSALDLSSLFLFKGWNQFYKLFSGSSQALATGNVSLIDKIYSTHPISRPLSQFSLVI